MTNTDHVVRVAVYYALSHRDLESAYVQELDPVEHDSIALQRTFAPLLRGQHLSWNSLHRGLQDRFAFVMQELRVTPEEYDRYKSLFFDV